MDIVADYAAHVGLGREEALDETLPWMLHVLHRRDVRQAQQIKLAARATHVSTAASFGAEGGAPAFNGFLEELEEVIRHDPFAPEEIQDGPTAAEIATFERFAQAAGDR